MTSTSTSTATATATATATSTSHVVIVGGGLAGLTAALHLLKSTASSSLRITLVEALNRLGGRVCGYEWVPGYPIDIGAEFIHCYRTMLTDTIKSHKIAPESNWEEYFVTSHADGGPDEHPTRDGKYGMYYVNGKLLMYNDPSLEPLNEALKAMVEEGMACDDPNRSVADAFGRHQLSPALARLARASYGNTAGNSDMTQLSLSMVARFEKYWEDNEEEGDYKLPINLGMSSVIRAMEEDLLKVERLTIRLDWPVATIENNNNNNEDGATCSPSVVVRGLNGECLSADAVICTAAPPLLPKLLPTLLTPQQRETIDHISLVTAMKVMLKFDMRPWPAHLQSVVCADGGPMPELWFRNDFVVKQNYGKDDRSYYIMVGFLASDFAEDFVANIQKIADEDGSSPERVAADQCLAQLSKILDIPLADLQAHHVDTLMHCWNAENDPYTPGGWMVPKVGITSIEPMEQPCIGGRVVLAGESTNGKGACITLQAAMQTGVRACQQVCTMLNLPTTEGTTTTAK